MKIYKNSGWQRTKDEVSNEKKAQAGLLVFLKTNGENYLN